MKRVLLVEDCAENQVLVRETLKEMFIETASTLLEAQSLLAKGHYDLILLDIKLPDGDGLRLLSMMQEQNLGNGCPTLVLSGMSDISNKVTAFSLGADDFLTKPFHPAELRARVGAKLRKFEAAHSADKVIRFAQLELNLESQRVYRLVGALREEIGLTSKEFRLMVFFSKRLERVVSRETLLSELWSGGVHVTDRTVDTHLSNLRKKIKDCGVEIEGVPHEGYRAVLAVAP